MADNYLERQMEQYYARKAAWEKQRKQRKKQTEGTKRSSTPISSPQSPYQDK